MTASGRAEVEPPGPRHGDDFQDFMGFVQEKKVGTKECEKGMEGGRSGKKEPPTTLGPPGAEHEAEKALLEPGGGMDGMEGSRGGHLDGIGAGFEGANLAFAQLGGGKHRPYDRRPHGLRNCRTIGPKRTRKVTGMMQITRGRRSLTGSS